MSAARSKNKKKKWAKGRSKEKKQNAVVYTQAVYDKVVKEIPRMKVITISNLSEKFQIGGALARRTITLLEKENLIKRVVRHSDMLVYTRVEDK
jgi:small subunit ribosomal protein S25e